MKDSLAHNGFVLWNLVNYNENLINSSFRAVAFLTAKEYFNDLLLNAQLLQMLSLDK